MIAERGNRDAGVWNEKNARTPPVCAVASDSVAARWRGCEYSKEKKVKNIGRATKQQRIRISRGGLMFLNVHGKRWISEFVQLPAEVQEDWQVIRVVQQPDLNPCCLYEFAVCLVED